MTDGVCLTARQIQVAERLLLAEGDKEIAKALHMKPRTVKAHLKQLCYLFAIRGWGVRRVRLAVTIHERRSELGVRCPQCESFDSPPVGQIL